MDEDSTVCRRDVSELVVARVGRVVSTGDPVLPWAVLDGAGAPVEPVAEFLRDLLACGSSAASCRSVMSAPIRALIRVNTARNAV